MSGVSREELLAQRAEIDRLRGRHPGMALLHGSELNIGQGRRASTTIPPFAASSTGAWPASIPTSTWTGTSRPGESSTAMEDPTVDAIAHLSGRRIGRRQGIDLDIDAVLQKAADTDTVIEINAALARLDASSDVLFRARDRAVTFVVSTDTHHTRELARMEWGALHAHPRLGRPLPHRQHLAAREVPRMAAEETEPMSVSPPARIFLLSPADSSGKRARLLQNPKADHDLARRVRAEVRRVLRSARSSASSAASTFAASWRTPKPSPARLGGVPASTSSRPAMGCGHPSRPFVWTTFADGRGFPSIPTRIDTGNPSSGTSRRSRRNGMRPRSSSWEASPRRSTSTC